MSLGYTAYNLTKESRTLVLEKFSPKFPRIIAHHITHRFKVSEASCIPYTEEVKVIGYISNDNIECLVVEVLNKKLKSDGYHYHLTLSHTDKAKPFHSNELIKNKGYHPIDPFFIKVKPSFNPF